MTHDKKTEKPKSNRPNKYEDKLVVKGSFMDIMRAAGKDAKNHNAPAKIDADKK